MFGLTRNTFRIDTAIPALQTAAVIAANSAITLVGKLNQYAVSLQSAALVGGVASLVSAVAQNFFKNTILRYLSIAVGALAGYAAHRFFFPSVSLDPRVAAATAGVLFVVRLASNHFPYPRERVAVAVAPTSSTTT
ncbi:hypothetical protein [Candidatus Protochlamydia phocaeensis]|uniref:hypothetical protein n=1 Tax=Candidatus Protochlamydia phocaeensis TaxID=1414722 RepID=UPI000837C179|nr:hypothetical protein [Candidatus Protochlamydia phocaeensis]